ncbi:hypothetical protein MC64_007075 [Aeromonas caviae]|uniref:hypothetical protein n=1 Tax=Aeromonas TaxID=642 RepID=UPI000538047F|nr:hypothetical protein [Aeromonas caviae]MDU1144107.1 hypothetical protein [Aeromonas hydrophila]PNO55268.1 hypothetical protein MC64_007075 [Aeromonas caviae]QUM02053.1 hypothetical protein IMO17_02775 [Aeromonas caviae]
MTDFIMTMLMITLLNVFIGSVAYIVIIFFVRKAERKKELTSSIKYNFVTVNIKEYTAAPIDLITYLSLVDVIPTTTVDIIPTAINDVKETRKFYAARKTKHKFSKNPLQKIHRSIHNVTNDSFSDILLREYNQVAQGAEIHEAPFEFHKLTVPC